MIRNFFCKTSGRTSLALILSCALAGAFVPTPSLAQTAKTTAKPDPKKAADKKAAATKKTADTKAGKKPDAPEPAGGGKPVLVASFGEWGAYTAAAGKARTCYALTKPKDRTPASLKRDPGFLFISNRPGEGVKNEVSFVMGFEVKPDSAPKAEIGATSFDMVSKGANLWVKNPAEEGQFVDALRKGQRLVVKAASKKGNMSTDSYALAGVAPALDRAAKDCQ